jgi:hypothetical protein
VESDDIDLARLFANEEITYAQAAITALTRE